MEKLDPEFKAKWVAALRGGKYEQGTSYLHEAGRYCCLGVACVVGGQKIVGNGGYIGPSNKNVPKILRGINKTTGHLSQMNDSESKSFNEIADYIESNL